MTAHLIRNVRSGYVDRTSLNAAMAGGRWRLRLASAGHLRSSDTAERALRHFLYFPLRHEPSHVALQPTAIDAGTLP